MIFMTMYFMYPCVYTASILPEISTFNCFSLQMGRRKFRLSVRMRSEKHGDFTLCVSPNCLTSGSSNRAPPIRLQTGQV